MKILLLSIDDYSKQPPGPQAIRIITLAEYLARYAELSMLITTPVKQENIPPGVDILSVDAYIGRSEAKRPLSAISRLMRLYRRVKALASEYDVLYTDATYYPSLGKRYRGYFIEVNGLMAPEMEMKGFGPFYSHIGGMLERRTLVKADGIIAVTEGLRNYLVETYGIPPERVVYVPNGIDLRRFSSISEDDVNTIRQKYGLIEGRTAVFAGSFRPWHDTHTIIRAFSKVAESIEDVRLLMIGQGPMKSSAEELAKELHLSGRVVFTGPVEYRSMPAYLMACDVGIHYSRESDRLRTFGESPLKINEYMASSLAVIAGPTPYVAREEIERGVVLGAGNEDELTEAMIRLFEDDSLRKRLATKGREFVARERSMEVISRRIYEFMEGVMA